MADKRIEQFPIGFVVLSHSEPQQLLRLVKTLGRLFDDPPIACHHDFDQCALPEELFPENVRFTRPHVTTKWGHISVPMAALKAVRLLLETSDPDWYILLSGSDYPVSPPDKILEELRYGGYDVYLDHREIRHKTIPPDQSASHGFSRPEWIEVAYRRYCSAVPRLPYAADRLLQLLNPDRPPHIFGGDFWFMANRKAIAKLRGPSIERLIRYYRKRFAPDESLFQTALCNEPDLRICPKSLRYEDWSAGGSHPKLLTVEDLPDIRTSGAHFARKFGPDSPALHIIDQQL
jgi:hypothetical protein